MSVFIKLIYKSLFQTFIENEANLFNLEVSQYSHQRSEYFDDAFKLILQNPNFLRNIKNLKLDFYISSENTTKFLEFLDSNCNSISSLHLLFPSYNNNLPMTEKALSQIINSQVNLKKILLGFNNFPLYHSLLSLKNSNCSNTLNVIVFYHIDFRNIVVLNEVFNQLNVLESIHLIYCLSINAKFLQQIINLTKPFKLKSLLLNKILEIESLELLIQKFGNHIENFGINAKSYPQQLVNLLELAMKHCYKIKFLHLPVGLNNQNIDLVFNLIGNITQNLNHLFIDAINNDYFTYNEIDNKIELSSILLQNLGQILPLKLEYLDLGLAIDGNDLEIFLKNSQNTFIKKLLIRNKRREEDDDIFPYIKDYIIKKKRVKYLSIIETFHENSKDLFSLKDKVKECELYGIQVLYYRDLYININCFIKETYL
ncbi:hypothetical protein GLOIN_2v1869164 [Rhizophagus clarus]|nr:hypothetical protein GLOIN_2v1869164 [Rhizophagus clarus]